LPDYTLASAIREVERWWREELKGLRARQRARLWLKAPARNLARAAADFAAHSEETHGGAIRGDTAAVLCDDDIALAAE
jgi:hypothetical protein